MWTNTLSWLLILCPSTWAVIACLTKVLFYSRPWRLSFEHKISNNSTKKYFNPTIGRLYKLRVRFTQTTMNPYDFKIKTLFRYCIWKQTAIEPVIPTFVWMVDFAYHAFVSLRQVVLQELALNVHNGWSTFHKEINHGACCILFRYNAIHHPHPVHNPGTTDVIFSTSWTALLMWHTFAWCALW
jgi:hypothetical protein